MLFFGIPIAQAVEITLNNPLAGGAPIIVSPFVLYGGFIRALIGLMGVIALFLFVIAGVMWVTAAGNDEKITKAKQIMVWAVIGIAVILGSYVILSAVFGVLPKATAPSAQQQQRPATPQPPAGTAPAAPAPSGAPPAPAPAGGGG